MSKTAECLKVESKNFKTYLDDEFVALKGQIIEFKLLDEIGFCADCGEMIDGKVRVWPGMKFLVVDVNILKGDAVCFAQNDSFWKRRNNVFR
jgi:hypothetical protein